MNTASVLRERLQSWLELKYGAKEVVTISAEPKHFVWLSMREQEPGRPTAVGIRVAAAGQPPCFELLESLRSGRQVRTFWSFDPRQGWKHLIDV